MAPHAGSPALAPRLLQSSFSPAMLPLNPDGLKAWLPDHLDLTRVHLLVVCAASLEAYINAAAFLHIAKTHLDTVAKGPLALTRVGQAIADPIQKSSSLDSKLDYAPHLFGVDIAKHVATWKRGYQIRCAVAHNGGLVDKKTHTRMPAPKPPIGTTLKMSWGQLRGYMQAADEIASIVDIAVSDATARGLEAWLVLREVRESSSLPARSGVWSYLHNEYGIRGIPKAMKERIVRDLFS